MEIETHSSWAKLNNLRKPNYLSRRESSKRSLSKKGWFMKAPSKISATCKISKKKRWTFTWTVKRLKKSRIRGSRTRKTSSCTRIWWKTHTSKCKLTMRKDSNESKFLSKILLWLKRKREMNGNRNRGKITMRIKGWESIVHKLQIGLDERYLQFDFYIK